MRLPTRFLFASVLSLGCLPVLAQAPAAGTPAPFAAGIELIEDLVAQSAQRHGYILTWEARPLAVRGVVLPVSGDIATEMRLLQSMLGAERSPLAIEVYRNSGVVRVTDAGEAGTRLRVTEQLFAGRIHRNQKQAPALAQAVEPAPAVAAAPAAAPLPAPAETAAAPAQAPAPELPAGPPAVAAAQPSAPVVDAAPAAAPAPVTVAPAVAVATTTATAQLVPAMRAVALPPAQPASDAAKAFQLPPGLAQAAFARIAAQHNYRLDWDVDEKDSVYAFDFPITVSGRDVAEDLTTLTKALSLNGAAHFRVDIYSGNRIIRVIAKD